MALAAAGLTLTAARNWQAAHEAPVQASADEGAES